ncbi:hypothetical protein EIN_418540 [Entamoeba invadens IP1]|uniref:Auto-transporter adhesin head GIN domain-containing protein n=1 Tax=Entamoeba invadens IP1 TaxID=370355 RepID=A0A0A1U7L2_ENTIV|nr:hypothetical protein EIN_418540 [Entamoeba invadens IP1]ELP87975.1 hypothetical protein EIN_418540 [Entamoeba invadens IP1]|eukprot:XP_004254746.1 hypothetical protein EIN_418540 [Entamoeba invadens IP1]
MFYITHLLFFISFSCGCLYGCQSCPNDTCERCESGFELVSTLCIDSQTLEDPNDGTSCNSGVCIFDYTKTTKSSVEIATDITSLMLPETKITIKQTSGQVHSIISGKNVYFDSDFDCDIVDVTTGYFNTTSHFDAINVSLDTLEIDGSVNIKRLNAREIAIKPTKIETQKIKEISLKQPFVFTTLVTDDQFDEISKNGIYLFKDTKINNPSNYSLTLHLYKLSNGKTTPSDFAFYDNLCGGVIAAFLPSPPKDPSTSCPDYIFVKPTTSMWWISASVMVFLIFVALFGASLYIAIKYFKKKKTDEDKMPSTN